MPPKKKKPEPPPQDRHRSGFMIRFPEEYREKFAELKKKTGRNYTVDAQWAVNAYLKANGIDPPDTST